eukprot:scaffold1866_cov15-Prasinocladus_malaysianus.AAC.1
MPGRDVKAKTSETRPGSLPPRRSNRIRVIGHAKIPFPRRPKEAGKGRSLTPLRSQSPAPKSVQ